MMIIKEGIKQWIVVKVFEWTTVVFLVLMLNVSYSFAAYLDEYIYDLNSSVPSVRKHAALYLGQAGEKSAVPVLIDTLKDSTADVRAEAAKSLGRIKDSRAVLALIEALSDEDVNVRMYAAYALGEIKEPESAEPLLEAFHDSAWCVRDQAAWALRELDNRSITEPLIAELKKKDADVEQIIWILRGIGIENSVGPLAKMLKEDDLFVRKRAVFVLSEIGGEQVVNPLINSLSDSSSEVRFNAVKALQKIGDDRAVEPLKKLVTKEDDSSVRRAAEKAIVQLSRHKNLVAFWNFDDQNTKTAKDVTNGGTDGQIIGCIPVEGKKGYALRFKQGTYISLGRPNNLPIANHPFTITAWVKSDAPNGVVVARGGAYCGYCLYLKDGVAKFGIHRVKDGPAYIAAGSEKVVRESLEDDKWIHLAGVVKNNQIEVYVNGKLAGTAETPGYIPGNCGQGMEIGYDQSTTSAEIMDYFQGIIDEVRVYDAALSEKEIQEQYRMEK